MCDHSNELSLAILSHGIICFAVFGKMKFGIFLEVLLWPVLGGKGLNAFIMLSDSEGSLVMLNSVEQSTCIIALKHVFYKVVFSRVG